MKQGYRILDSDMHVIEPHDLWSQRLPARYRDRAPRLAQLPEGGVTWQCEGRFYPAWSDHPQRQALNRARYDQGHPKFRRYDEALARGFDAKAQLDAMDAEGIDVAVTFRTIASHVIADDAQEPAFSAALCRAWNEWMSERVAETPARAGPPTCSASTPAAAGCGGNSILVLGECGSQSNARLEAGEAPWRPTTCRTGTGPVGGTARSRRA